MVSVFFLRHCCPGCAFERVLTLPSIIVKCEMLFCVSWEVRREACRPQVSTFNTKKVSLTFSFTSGIFLGSCFTTFTQFLESGLKHQSCGMHVVCEKAIPPLTFGVAVMRTISCFCYWVLSVFFNHGTVLFSSSIFIPDLGLLMLPSFENSKIQVNPRIICTRTQRAQTRIY